LKESEPMATDGDRENKEPTELAPSPETRTIQELIDAGYAGHVRGSDGGAMIEVEPPRSPEEAVTRKWQQ
jgi:hypothetical protein